MSSIQSAENKSTTLISDTSMDRNPKEQKGVEGEEKQEATELHGLPLVICLLGLMIANFIVALDMTITLTLQSAIENKFKSFGNIGWVVTGYALPLSVFASMSGRMGMIIGLRPTLMICCVVFEIGSLVSALSNSMNMLIGGRVISGIGGSGIQNSCMLILTEIFPLSKRGLATTSLSVAYSIASVVGPLVGGAFASSSRLTWRWAFYLNLPVGGVVLLTLAVGYVKVPTKWEQFKKGSLKYKVFIMDVPGVILIAIGTTLVLLAMSFGGNEFAWDSAVVISFFTVGGAVMVVFFYYEFVVFDKITADLTESYGKLYPLISVLLFKNFNIMIAMASLSLETIAYYGISTYVTTYFEIIRGYSPQSSGIRLLPLIIPGTFSSIAAGVIMSKTGFLKPFIVVGSIFGAVGSGLLLLMGENSSVGQNIGYLILPGAAFGMILIPVFMTLQMEVRQHAPELLNIVTTFFTFTRSLAASVGSNLATTVFTVVATREKDKYLGLKSYDISVLMAYRDLDLGLTLDEISNLSDGLIIALRAVFYMCLGFSCVNVVAACFNPNNKIDVHKKKNKSKDVEEQKDEEDQGVEEGSSD